MKYILVTGWSVAVLVFVALAVVAASDLPQTIGARSEVTVFLEDGISRAQGDDIRATLTQLEITRELTYISKAGAYAEFKRIYRDQPELWKNMDAEILPAAFRVRVKSNPEGAKQILAALKGAEGVEEITPNPQAQPYAFRRQSGWETWRNGWGIGALIVLVPLTIAAASTRRRHGH